MSALQIIRKPATRQQIQHLVDMMACLTCDEGSALVEALHGMMKGSLYYEYGSVDLGDIATQMQSEADAFDVSPVCGHCSGSGEGQYDGTNCGWCKGKGEHSSPRQIAERAYQLSTRS